MHFSALFLLCAFLAVCSELSAYQGNGYAVRGRSLRRSINLVLGQSGHGDAGYARRRNAHTGYVHPPFAPSRLRRRSQAAEVEQPTEVHVPVPDVHAAVPQEENVHLVNDPEVFVHDAPIEQEQEVIPQEIELFPAESEVTLEALVAPLEHEELPLLEEPVLVHEPELKSDLSVLYDYLYPMVLRKCLASAITSAMGSNSEDYNVNYKHQLKYIDHPLIQISGLDTLEELRRNLTAVAVSRRRFSRLPKMTSGCVFHFSEIDADMQAAKEDLILSHDESLSEEGFRLDNKYILKYERLFKKDFMMHLIIRKLYELLRNRTPMYDIILALDDDMEKYIKYWNTKH